MLLIILLVSITLAQYSPLPDCQAISLQGDFFDWTSLGNMTIRTKYINANACGKDACGGACSFCASGNCRGYNLPPPNHARWFADNKTNGVVSFAGDGAINFVCDPSVITPKITGGDVDGGYPYILTLTSRAACPIGKCPGGCNYAQGWGSCHPKSGFTCSCNTGFIGDDCNMSIIDTSLTVTTGTYVNGFVAGGKAWIGFEIYDSQKNLVPCSARLPISPNNYYFSFRTCTNGLRNYTLTGTKSGVIETPVSLFNEPLAGSPFYYIISPGLPNYKFATISGNGLKSAKVGQNTTFDIQLVDEYKNNVVTCPFEISNQYIGTLYGTAAAQVSFNCYLGVVTGTYQLPRAGLYQLTVRFQNNMAPGFPLQVTAFN